MTNRSEPQSRDSFRHFRRLTTRWMDNDVYGHVNNVVYYSFFDTAVNGYLVDAGLLDPQCGEVIGLVVQTQCDYFAPIEFPMAIDAGLRVDRIGQSSVRYGVGLFAEHEGLTAAAGHFVHVYVNRTTRRPTQLPEALRQALQELA